MKLDIKRLEKEGKIRTLEDAFKDFPVEEEWHKGHLEDYYINEKVVPYSKCDIGDIVFVKKYKYNDGSAGSNHLFVILETPDMLIPFEYAYMLISSRIEKRKHKTNIFITKTYNNGLLKNSIIKTDVVYKTEDKYIIGKIGKLEEDEANDILNKYSLLFSPNVILNSK